jgi:hypothetical protein
MTFTLTQIALIGVIVSLLAQGIKLAAAKFKVTISRPVVSVVVLVVALVLAWIWNPPAMPAFPALTGDPAALAVAITSFLVALIQLAAYILGIAFFIYNTILSKLFEALGWDSSTVKAKVIAAETASVGVEPASKTPPQS